MASRTLGEGRKPMNLSEAMQVFLVQKQVDGLSKRTIDFYRGKIEMFIDFTGVFVNRKRAHLIIENGPTWGIKGSAVIIENEPI